MLSGVYRRSPRIVELDARKAQARSQNKGNVICEVVDEEEPEKGHDILKQKRRRKKVKARTVQDLVVNSVEYKLQKTDAGNDEDGLVKNAAIVPSGAAIPEKGKLELLLGILQRRDTYKIFAEPVNPEEVEYYYDVIKEPMDFGTVAKKLNEGSYQTLEEFEHDVFLVPNNAMLFNASNTIYYRQARALKELATKLFHALKTDPESFESEASLQRMGLGRSTKAGVGILNCNNKINTSIAAGGYRSHQQFNDVDVERRRTYRPWKSLLSENGSLFSAVHNSPKPLVLNAEADIGYLESLKRFSKDLGPVAQKVTMKKVNSYISEAMRVWNVTTNSQVWPPNMQIPNAPSASNIKVAPSFKVPSSTPGCQNISVDKMNVHSGFSHGGQAPMDGNMTINNALTGGISQPGGSRVESFGDFQGNRVPSVSRGFAPSSGYQTLAGETMDGPTFFWNGGKVSAGYNVDMADAFKDYAANQSNGVHLDSSFPNYDSGKPKLDLSESWNTKGKQKELGETSMMVNPGDKVYEMMGLLLHGGGCKTVSLKVTVVLPHLHGVHLLKS
ncbi:bromodomain-containing protein 7-like isoform X2 [Hibiscus syriacus]|uniref:bromodomain-containing protein 7-like isoform X2 n=1 Tax=Hibiscus syriacus TaxID=106335 RepID=UPI001920737E|nr:bromodomain-containing protein 7-like isoform X2 [Hibiscus syriacus]